MSDMASYIVYCIASHAPFSCTTIHSGAGKSDQSAAGAAYDSLVNQLLALMDGLRSVKLYLQVSYKMILTFTVI